MSPAAPTLHFLFFTAASTCWLTPATGSRLASRKAPAFANSMPVSEDAARLKKYLLENFG